MSAKAKVWYRSLGEIQTEIEDLRIAFNNRCSELGRSSIEVRQDYYRDSIARIVHESNWQEGIELELGRTKALANEAFERIVFAGGPHLDVEAALGVHAQAVREKKAAKVSVEELAAYNLSATHHYMAIVVVECMLRNTARVVLQLRQMNKEAESKASLMLEERAFGDALKALDAFVIPYTDGLRDMGEVFRRLLEGGVDALKHPMKVQFVHFLHRTLMMGILSSRKCGAFRKIPVHIEGNPELVFPPASLVDAMMHEFCGEFPVLSKMVIRNDVLMTAARVSHRFTKIHPYEDGNGRMSRVLMNLILSVVHPAVHLKANAKGKHRYGWALRRADRGNLEPLAALIGMSVRDAYLKILRSLGI
ncbi:Fic family protein [Myxococcus landrumensis]|uniref:Fic family protein n=1 Tax=Myxococcus landrumensis TaxID=2813577 RepID=A0ABX7N8W2_9BACT|nr:Fic family protein [Myxococcus landrumus]QSQ14863.1 Fic family protein [Myxococcus landrumus]